MNQERQEDRKCLFEHSNSYDAEGFETTTVAEMKPIK